jgi:hypothetical protein
MDSILEHREARARLAAAMIADDHDIELLARELSQRRDAKTRAMDEYQSHMLVHQVEQATPHNETSVA